MSENWKEIWERKGREDTGDLRLLDGFEDTAIEPRAVAEQITELLGIRPTDTVLEVGCGAGMLAQYFTCEYVGVDYSPSLVAKHIELLDGTVLVAEAAHLPFSDRSFDKAFCFSVFQYFPGKEYAAKAVDELRRISKGGVFLGDLCETSHRSSHLLFSRGELGGTAFDGFYNAERFNLLL